MSDLKHLPYLAAVAEEDVRFLKMREEHYQGSWKESGGRSAWFMLRRKMDRLIHFLARPTDPHGFSISDLVDAIPEDDIADCTVAAIIVRHLKEVYISEDIFAKIEEEPSGADGTVLAEIRDLRRYLLLCEAEMVARGVVADPVRHHEARFSGFTGTGMERPFGYEAK